MFGISISVLVVMESSSPAQAKSLERPSIVPSTNLILSPINPPLQRKLFEDMKAPERNESTLIIDVENSSYSVENGTVTVYESDSSVEISDSEPDNESNCQNEEDEHYKHQM